MDRAQPVPQEFKDGLLEVEGLFCNHSGSKRYICVSRADVNIATWTIACSDGLSQYWTRDFTYQDVLKMVFCASFEALLIENLTRF